MSNDNSLSEKKSSRNFLKVFILGLIIFIIILLGATGYLFYQYQKFSRSPVAAQIASQEETKKLVSAVEKLMLLPKNETPSIATVTDMTKLKNQPFFHNAKNGDKLLIYTGAKEAILYNPLANLIVNVGPVNFAGQQNSQAQQAKIGLWNGTTKVGLTQKIAAEIQKSFPGIDIVLKDQSKQTYDITLIIPLNDASKNAASDLAKSLNSQVTTLPDGEIKPSGVDILVIVGKDKI